MNNSAKRWGIFVVILLLVTTVLLGKGIFRWTTIESGVVITVTDKERVVKNDGEKTESYYLVFSKEETFSIRDDWYNGRFGASDTYGSLEQGKTYKLRVSGWRVKLFSWYRNVLDVEPAAEPSA